jgi:roadblock/LC7 domain-containing protein
MVNSVALLEELFQLDGVTAIAKLDDMGRIVDWKAKGVVDPEMMRETSKGLEEIISLFVQGARDRPRNWIPWRSMTYSGGDMTAIAAGKDLVVVETAKVDMDKILKTMNVLGLASKR